MFRESKATPFTHHLNVLCTRIGLVVIWLEC